MSVDITTIKRHAVGVVFGTDEVGPSAEPPQVKFNPEIYESLIQEVGLAITPVAGIITKNEAEITIKTKNIDFVMTQQDAVSVGDDIYAAANSKALVLAPIDAPTEKVLTFTNCFFVPDGDYTPPAGEDHTASIKFIARPDTTTGKLFTWATP